jgi:uncharacterized protein YdeI (YjbR/CyaY-like superfamily)
MTDAILTFATQAAWDAWLEHQASSSTGVWLRLAKKGATEPTVTYAQAVESALCHGWIDGRKQTENAHYWLQRFTPRAARSIWSQINRQKAQALIASGRMRPAGLRQVQLAQEDGRWDAAYAPASTSTVPEDLQRAMDAHPRAKEFFATLNSRNRYAVLFRVHNAKKPETRARKIAQFMDMLSRGEAPYP